MSKLLYDSPEWDIPTIEKTWKEIDRIGRDVFGLDYHDPQIEIITSEQMMDFYSSNGLPISYSHWSFGKSFAQTEHAYVKGQMGLAYEIVINTKPTIAYLMENNTMTMQTLVMAHAVCGHGSFFKNNYMFKEWTNAEYILDYMRYAKNYIAECEARYGKQQVELVLDACHALKYYSVDKYKRPNKPKRDEVQARKELWAKMQEESFSDLWKTLPQGSEEQTANWLRAQWKEIDKGSRTLPEENILYFLEKHSPTTETWEREICRIVRKIAQYFYPQMHTQLMNEGWATFWHYNIMYQMYDEGLISSGHILEFLQSHSGVVAQPDFDSKYYSGINVYALGFAMMQDIRRICENPDDEDRKWFPDLAGKDWLPTMKEIMENYRDESFVMQFLSPKVIRKFKLFALYNSDEEANYKVTCVHDDDDVLNIRKALAKQYDLSYKLPQMEIVRVKDDEYRKLELKHSSLQGEELDVESAQRVLSYLDYLWGYTVEIVGDD